MINFHEPMYFEVGDQILTHLAINKDGCFTVMRAMEHPTKGPPQVRWKALRELYVGEVAIPPCMTYDEYARDFINAVEQKFGMPFVPWVDDGDLVPTKELATIAMLADHEIPERFLTGCDVAAYLLIKTDPKGREASDRNQLEGRRIRWVQNKAHSAVSYIVDQAFKGFGRPKNEPDHSLLADAFIKESARLQKLQQEFYAQHAAAARAQAPPSRWNGTKDSLDAIDAAKAVFRAGMTPQPLPLQPFIHKGPDVQ